MPYAKSIKKSPVISRRLFLLPEIFTGVYITENWYFTYGSWVGAKLRKFLDEIFWENGGWGGCFFDFFGTIWTVLQYEKVWFSSQILVFIGVEKQLKLICLNVKIYFILNELFQYFKPIFNYRECGYLQILTCRYPCQLTQLIFQVGILEVGVNKSLLNSFGVFYFEIFCLF